jgi:hypothetical protein
MPLVAKGANEVKITSKDHERKYVMMMLFIIADGFNYHVI